MKTNRILALVLLSILNAQFSGLFAQGTPFTYQGRINFAPVSPLEVLNKVAALPITTWNFKTMNDGRHMGPMAQDFYAAFGLGGGDTTITSVDPDGVALAAIQGLNQKLEQKEKEITELKQSVNELKQLLHAMNHKLNG